MPQPAAARPPCIHCGAPEPDHDPGCSYAPTLADFFGAPIHVYSRNDALEDGVLVDARIGEFAEVTAQHFGPSCPVVLTSGLFELMRRAVEHPRHCNDWRGVWHDILWMARGAARYACAFEPHRNTFEVIITGTGRTRLHTLAVAWDGEAFTFMLPEED